MDFVEFINEKKRVTDNCKIDCIDCIFFEIGNIGDQCKDLIINYPEKFVKILEDHLEQERLEKELIKKDKNEIIKKRLLILTEYLLNGHTIVYDNFKWGIELDEIHPSYERLLFYGISQQLEKEKNTFAYDVLLKISERSNSENLYYYNDKLKFERGEVFLDILKKYILTNDSSLFFTKLNSMNKSFNCKNNMTLLDKNFLLVFKALLNGYTHEENHWKNSLGWHLYKFDKNLNFTETIIDTQKVNIYNKYLFEKILLISKNYMHEINDFNKKFEKENK